MRSRRTRKGGVYCGESESYCLCLGNDCYDFGHISQSHSFETTEGFVHSVNYPFATINRTYQLYVRCQLQESENIAGNSADFLLFTVDVQKPYSAIYSGEFSDVNKAYMNHPISGLWTNDLAVKVGCNDPYIDNLLGPVNYYETSLGEYGCGDVYYCEGIYCTPNSTYAEGGMEDPFYTYDDGTARYKVDLQWPKDICYYGVDRGNNKGSQKCELAMVEKNPPYITNIGNVLITNDTETTIHATIINYVYNANLVNEFIEIPVSFSNFTLETDVTLNASLSDAELFKFKKNSINTYKLHAEKNPDNAHESMFRIYKDTTVIAASPYFNTQLFGKRNNVVLEVNSPDLNPALILAHFDEQIDADHCVGDCTAASVGVTLADGNFGKGAFMGHFGGVSDSLSYDSVGNFDATQGTISFWVSPSGWNGDDGLRHTFVRVPGMAIYKSTNGRIAFDHTGPGGDVAYDVNSYMESGNWYHIAATWNSVLGEYRLYIDGIEDDEGIVGFSPSGTAGAITVGMANENNFVIDELFISMSDKRENWTRNTPVPDKAMNVKVNGESVLSSSDESIVYGSIDINGNTDVVFSNISIADNRLMSPVIGINISVPNGTGYVDYKVMNTSGSFMRTKTFAKVVKLLTTDINYIFIKSWDRAGNHVSKPITIYYDAFGPVLQEAKIFNNNTEEIQDDSDKFAEFGTDVRFNMSIDDEKFTKMVGQSNQMAVELSNPGLLYKNLVLLYHFENYSSVGEGTTTVTDFSTEQNNGRLIDVTHTPNGKWGGAGVFDAIPASSVTIKDDESLDMGVGDFTIAAWVKMAPITGEGAIFSKMGFGNVGYSLYVSAAGMPNMAVSDGANSAFGVIPFDIRDGNWHLLTAVKRGDTGKIFIDGILGDTIDTSTVGSLDNDGDAIIGATFPLGSDMVLDTTMVWNVSMKDNEVLNLYNTKYLLLNTTKESEQIFRAKMEETDVDVGTIYARYYMFDKYNTINDAGQEFVITDTVPPKFNITIDCGKYKDPLQYQTCKDGILVRYSNYAQTYTVNLTTTEPLNASKFNITYTFNEEEDYVEMNATASVWIDPLTKFAYNRFNGTITIASTGK